MLAYIWCYNDRFPSFAFIRSLFVHIRHTMSLSLFTRLSKQTWDDPSMFLHGKKFHRLNVQCKWNFYFRCWKARRTSRDARLTMYSEMTIINAYRNCHCRSLSDIITIWMRYSTIDNHSSVNKYHIEFTSFSPHPFPYSQFTVHSVHNSHAELLTSFLSLSLIFIRFRRCIWKDFIASIIF